MRRLVLLRGAPGCGKSTFVRDHGLSDLVVSSDAIRRMLYPMVHTLDGDRSILGGAERTVWQMVSSIVEERMRRGATVVIDATNLSPRDQQPWYALARTHLYRVGMVDCQAGVSDDELRRRNRLRGDDRVADAALETMIERAHQNVVAPDVELLDNDAALRRFLTVPGRWVAEGVTVIGDVQSCPNALRRALADTPDDNLVVFAGDLFDRGPDAYEVFEQVSEIDSSRIALVRGNHEERMRQAVANGLRAPLDAGPRASRRSYAQILVGLVESDGREPREVDATIRELLYGIVPYVTFRLVGDKTSTTHLVTHGGVTYDTLTTTRLVSATGDDRFVVDDEFAYGTGDRDATYRHRGTYRHVDAELAASFEHAPGRFVQFHGHRNGGRGDTPHRADAVPGVFNLENRVEHGGTLRVARCTVTDGRPVYRIDEYEERIA